MPEGHGIALVLVLDLDVGEVIVDPVVELELALLHELHQGRRGHGLEGRGDEIDGVAGGRRLDPDVGQPGRAGPDDALA
jgi:hypothetical protein